MKFLILAMLPAAATAQSIDCARGDQQPMALSSWSAESLQIEVFGIPKESVKLSFMLENMTGKSIIAIDGSVSVFDPLGRFMFAIDMPEIPTFEGDTLSISGEYGVTKGVLGLASLPPERVTVIACTSEVAYADGTVETFD